MTQRATATDDLIDNIARRALELGADEIADRVAQRVIDHLDGAGAAGERMDAPAAASYLGVARRTIYAWIRQGKGPPHRRMGRKLVFDRRELDLWAERAR